MLSRVFQSQVFWCSFWFKTWRFYTVYGTDTGIQSFSQLLTDNFLKTAWTTLARLAVIFQNCTNKWDYFPLQPVHFPLWSQGTKVPQPLTGEMTLMETFSFEEHSAESWQPAAVSTWELLAERPRKIKQKKKTTYNLHTWKNKSWYLSFEGYSMFSQMLPAKCSTFPNPGP